MINSPLLDLLP
ncbi:unnamed protein product, partial [Rotaria sordida]